MALIYSYHFTSRNIHPSTTSLIKRLIDIVGSLVGLVILAIFLLPIAIAIKLDTPGPILFSQTRCGLHGKRFKIYKFRSMVYNAEDLKYQVTNEALGPFFKNEQDPRITTVGRFLRRTSLDELPQFWNVLIGEMSLVGTRPPSFDEVIHYHRRYWQRLNVKPGLTGEWQVNGRSKVKDFETVFYLDMRYQKHWSIWHDILLIGKTIHVVVKQLGSC